MHKTQKIGDKTPKKLLKTAEIWAFLQFLGQNRAQKPNFQPFLLFLTFYIKMHVFLIIKITYTNTVYKTAK